MKYRQLLLKLHFGLLLFAFLNFILRQLTDFSVSTYLIFHIKICIYISGLMLLYLTIRPFEKKAIYFSIYLLSPLGVLLSWLADGIFGAIIGSLFMWTITVDDFVAKNDDYKISQPFVGFMAPCCKYSLKKDYYYLIEKKIGDFWFELPDVKFTSFSADEKNKILKLRYQRDDINNNKQTSDTTITFNNTTRDNN